MRGVRISTCASLIDFLRISTCKNDNSMHINTMDGGVGKLASTRYAHTLAVDSAQTFRTRRSEVQLANRYSVLATHYSLLTTHYSLLTTYHSLLTGHWSLPTSHYSLLTAYCSLLRTRFSLLTTHYSLLPIHHSLLTTRYPTLTTHN
jgi:hypothetical protein